MTTSGGQRLGGQVESQQLRNADALVFVAGLDDLQLNDEDAHHLQRVLRLAPGSTVIASDGERAWRTCRLDVLVDERPAGRHPKRSASSLHLVASGPITIATRRSSPLTIGFALVKGDRPEWSVQKLTELGIDRILPFIGDRGVVRLDAGAAKARGERLRRVAREAAAQSRRVLLPEVADPVSLDELLEQVSRPIYFAEPGGSFPSGRLQTLIVGPEGGFTERELGRADGLIGLSENVLRSDTAALVSGFVLTALDNGVLGIREEC